MPTARVIFVCTLFVTLSLPAMGSDRSSGLELSRLPVAAQAPVSAALGRAAANYQVHRKGARLEMENAEQALIADFTSKGVDVHSGDSHWKLALHAYGYGSGLRAVSNSAPLMSGNRVEYRRGLLTEWYLNGPLGLEQGFTIEKRPGKANGQPLTVALAFSGALHATDARQPGPEPGYDGKAVLRYSGLVAYDAAGLELIAWEELRDGRLLLKVNDASARYPIVIDPWLQLGKLTAAAPRQAAELGYSVALSGNTIAVGAPFDTVGTAFPQGSVYVFVEPASGWANMTQTARLTASDGISGDLLGVSVGISGNTIVAGADGANVGPNAAQGAAYVFVEPTTGWADMTETAKLTTTDGALHDFAGASVSINGDTIAVGADGAAVSSHAYQGAVYLFVKPSGGWTTTSDFTAKITTFDGANRDQFGYSTSLSGDTLAVGARSVTIDANSSQGAVYVYSKPQNGWVTTSGFNGKLLASDGAAGDLLGSSVSISDDNTVAVAAPNAAVGSNPQQGAIYVFVEPASGWTNLTQTAKLTASTSSAGDQLGFSVSISPNGKRIVAGAPGNSAGMVYIFAKPVAGWTNETQIGKVAASDGKPATWLGFGVTADISTVFGGAPCTTVKSSASRPPVIFGNNQCQGALYVFAFSH